MTACKLLLALGLAALLAACAGGNFSTVSYVDHYPYYSPGVVQWAAIDGEFNTEIYGDPFGGGRFDNEAIANSLRSPAYISPAKMTTRPTRIARRSRWDRAAQSSSVTASAVVRTCGPHVATTAARAASRSDPESK